MRILEDALNRRRRSLEEIDKKLNELQIADAVGPPWAQEGGEGGLDIQRSGCDVARFSAEPRPRTVFGLRGCGPSAMTAFGFMDRAFLQTLGLKS